MLKNVGTYLVLNILNMYRKINILNPTLKEYSWQLLEQPLHHYYQEDHLDLLQLCRPQLKGHQATGQPVGSSLKGHLV